MSEVERLHDEVVRNPESDEPRLAYAASVKGRDPERAELIRIQMELLRSLRDRQPRGTRTDLYTRQRVLLDRHKNDWARAVLELGVVTRVNFLRGFVEWIAISGAAFRDHAQKLYS